MEIVSIIIAGLAFIWSVITFFHSKKNEHRISGISDIIKELKRSNELRADHQKREVLPVFEVLGFNVDNKFIIIRIKLHHHNITVEDIRLSENDFCWLDNTNHRGYFDRTRGLHFTFAMQHNLGPSIIKEGPKKDLHIELIFKDSLNNRLSKKFHLVNNEVFQDEPVYI